jgi:hypothetical protein
MKAYHGIQAIVETQALIIINEKLRELSNQIDEAHVCFLPFAAKRIAEKIICFLSNAVLRQVIEAKIHKLIVCF